MEGISFRKSIIRYWQSFSEKFIFRSGESEKRKKIDRGKQTCFRSYYRCCNVRIEGISFRKSIIRYRQSFREKFIFRSGESEKRKKIDHIINV